MWAFSANLLRFFTKKVENEILLTTRLGKTNENDMSKGSYTSTKSSPSHTHKHVHTDTVKLYSLFRFNTARRPSKRIGENAKPASTADYKLQRVAKYTKHAAAEAER